MSDAVEFLRLHAELAESDGCPEEAEQLRDVAAEIERLRAERDARQRDLETSQTESVNLKVEIERLRAEIKHAENKYAEVYRFMDDVRAMARGRSPQGATLLDFMAVWNEQYEDRIKKLELETERLRAELTFWKRPPASPPDDDSPCASGLLIGDSAGVG